jgi:CBS domain-containing protein
MLGFTEVYDYVPGKVDWLAHNLPVEGERPEAPIAGRVMRHDAVLCRPTDRICDVCELIARSPYPFALVTGDDGTLLGRAPSTALDPASERPIWEVAEPGPKTFRPHASARNVAEVLADKGLRWAIVTTPEGRVLGIASRADLERLAGDGE